MLRSLESTLSGAECSAIEIEVLEANEWHDAFGDPTLADAFLDRLVSNAYRLELEGESMRAADCPPELQG